MDTQFKATDLAKTPQQYEKLNSNLAMPALKAINFLVYRVTIKPERSCNFEAKKELFTPLVEKQRFIST